MRKALATIALSSIVLLVVAPSAWAKDFTLPEASVDVVVQKNGHVRITEHITYDFSGDFEGGYREIPLAGGSRMEDVSVSEGGLAYSPGASAELGSSGGPDTFGTTLTGGGVRIVWHYRASDERRTFDVSYTLVNFLVVYDDVADLNLKVWGPEWDVTLDQLTAQAELPAPAPGEVRVWGHARLLDVGGAGATGSSGATALNPGGTGATLSASNVAPGNWVEMRLVFPSSVLRSSEGAIRVSGDGLDLILAKEKGYADLVEVDQARRERDKDRLRWIIDNLPWLLLAALAAAALPALVTGFFIWRNFGKEPTVTGVPEHIFEPPGDEPPALVAALIAPTSTTVTGDAFAATLFDLIRRGHIDAAWTLTEKSTWAGLKKDDVSDLVLTIKKNAVERERPGSKDEMRPFEKEVYDAFEYASQGDDRFHLTEMKDEIKKNPTHFHKVFTDFKKKIGDDVRSLAWWITKGAAATGWAVAVAWLGTIGAGIMARVAYQPGGTPWATIAWAAVALAAAGNAVLLTVFIANRKGWERRSQEGAEQAAQWSAFKKFLTDFAGMKEATPGSI
ncbi:MAG: DUF2207 domain-containing protein, partial [Actinomycetota bacterium]